MEVSRSGFYHWRSRPLSATAERRQELSVLIYEAFHVAGDGTYGYRRVHAHLARLGIECSAELVRQIMRDMVSRTSGRWKARRPRLSPPRGGQPQPPRTPLASTPSVPIAWQLSPTRPSTFPYRSDPPD
ncbi:IS3 family transposase [Catenulispora yoronensis]|uniref:IS3 family transposase n=1 Tax=Catenulispora yoronensis TaxID=450799 RepID=UPI00362E183B